MHFGGESQSMIVTIFGAIIIGVFVFFFSQIILELYVKPLQEYRKPQQV